MPRAAPAAPTRSQRTRSPPIVAEAKRRGPGAWRSIGGARAVLRARRRRAGGWARLRRSTQLDATARRHRFVAWLMVTGRLAGSAELPGARPTCGWAPSRPAIVPARARRFAAAGARRSASGAARRRALQWISAGQGHARCTGVAPGRRSARRARRGARRSWPSSAPAPGRGQPKRRRQAARRPATGLQLHAVPRRAHRPSHPAGARPTGGGHRQWAAVAPAPRRRAAQRYLDQIALSLRPATVEPSSTSCASSPPGWPATHPTVTSLRRPAAPATSRPTRPGSRPSAPGHSGEPLQPATPSRARLDQPALLLRPDHRMGLPRRPGRAR